MPAPKHKRNWKRVEREVAKLLGGERIPVNGRHDRDITTNLDLWVDVKSRASVSEPLIARLKKAQYAIQSGTIIYVPLSVVINTQSLKDIEIISENIRSGQVTDWLDNIRISCPDGNVPCVILHRPGIKYIETVAVFNIDDFETWRLKIDRNP